MPSPSDELLLDRELKQALIAQLKTPGKTVVSLKANIPGPDKQIPESYLLLSLARAALPFEKTAQIKLHDGPDGPCAIYILENNPAASVKKAMMVWEETSPIGRFVDIDVFGEETHSIFRNDLRRCYLCEQPAFVCARNQTHKTEDLLDHIRKHLTGYLVSTVRNLIDSAIRLELDLDPKFGLVTPGTSGSHPDMDHPLMVLAKEAILDPLVSMFGEGMRQNDPLRLFQAIRLTGIGAEKAMLSATGGINAYKGLIFSLGLGVAAAGYAVGHNLPFEAIFECVKGMTQNIMEELNREKGTFGLEAWRKFGFGGARKEAWLGLPSVRKSLPLLKDFSKERLTMTLLSIIGESEDTVLLKRCGSMETYRIAKKKMATLKTYDESKVREITDWCIQSKISFGGSADLLVVTIFLKQIANTFVFVSR